MRTLFLVLSLLAFSSCATPTPVPTRPPDAGPPDAPVVVSDIFAGKIYKCAKAEASPVGAVMTCLDASNTDECLTGLAGDSAPVSVVTAIACTVRDLEQNIYPEIAKGTATEAMIQEAQAASRWINDHGIGFYAE